MGVQMTEATTKLTESTMRAMGYAGVTQKQLAMAIGLKPQMLNNRLTGITRWTLDEAHLIARYFGVTVGDLLNGPGDWILKIKITVTQEYATHVQVTESDACAAITGSAA
jgi:plasmid maintenance system antidote protein VapI